MKMIRVCLASPFSKPYKLSISDTRFEIKDVLPVPKPEQTTFILLIGLPLSHNTLVNSS